MDSYSEVRRVRMSMSADAGHDIRKLAAKYNELRASVASRIVDPGTKAEHCAAPKPPVVGLPDGAVIMAAE